MQLELMRRYGAERAVVFWGRRSDNESIAESARRHPDRLIAFASISPERLAYRQLWNRDDPGCCKRWTRCSPPAAFAASADLGGALPLAGTAGGRLRPERPTMTGILALARRYRVPVLLHVESTRMRELSALLERFPDVAVIWAHGGYTPLFIARRMLERHPNLDLRAERADLGPASALARLHHPARWARVWPDGWR